MPVAAFLERLLLDATNDIVSDSSDTQENLKLYAQDIDIPRLIMQLRMLPDLLKTYNEKNPSVRICKVTNLRTICEVMNDVSSSKSIFSEVFKLLKIALTIPVTIQQQLSEPFPHYAV